MTDKNSKENKNNHDFYLSIGIGLGVVMGAAIGVILKNIAIGAGIGMLLGIVIGVLIEKNSSNMKRSVIKIVMFSILGTIIVLLIPKILETFW